MKALVALTILSVFYSSYSLMDQANVNSLWTCFTTNCTQYYYNITNSTGFTQATNLVNAQNNITVFQNELNNVTDTDLAQYLMCEINCLAQVFPITWQANFGPACSSYTSNTASGQCYNNVNCNSTYTYFFGNGNQGVYPNIQVNSANGTTFAYALANQDWANVVGCLIGNTYMNA